MYINISLMKVFIFLGLKEYKDSSKEEKNNRLKFNLCIYVTLYVYFICKNLHDLLTIIQPLIDIFLISGQTYE